MKIRPGEMIRSTWAEPSFPVSVRTECLSRGAGKLAGDLTQEAGAVGNCGAEILGNGLPQIGQNRHVFTGMVGGGPARIGIATVVRGNDQQIGEPEQRQEVAQPSVKFFERLGKTLDILAVTVEHIEIDEVGKDETALAVA